MRSALRLLLKEHGLTYVTQDDVLLITTPEDADNRLETKIYPVGDLVLPLNSTAETEPDFDSLIEMIKSTVKPTSWDDSGGVGTLSEFENTLSLVISETEDVHEEIDLLFERLRGVSREQAKAGLPAFKRRSAPKRRPSGPNSSAVVCSAERAAWAEEWARLAAPAAWVG